MKTQRILTIVDKPKHPQTALARTAQLLHVNGGQAHLAAFCWNPALEDRKLVSGVESRKARKAVLDERRTWLHDEVSRHRDLAGAQTSVIWARDIAESLHAVLEKDPADLIVKTLHQSRTMIHTPLDWDILRMAPAPVLLVTPRRRRQSGAIVVAVDPYGDDRAHQRLNRRVMDAAMSMAELEGSTIHVVAALSLNPVLTDLEVVDKRTVQKRLRERVERQLATLLEPYDIPASRIHTPASKVGQAVDQVARTVHADLAVVGICAHPVKQALGIGNSAERIVARLQCDVLAVNP